MATGTQHDRGRQSLPVHSVFATKCPALPNAGLTAETKVLDFKALLADRTGVSAAAQELLAGFPPRPVQVLGLQHRCWLCRSAWCMLAVHSIRWGPQYKLHVPEGYACIM